EQFATPLLGNAGPVVLHQYVDVAALRLDRDEHPATAIFGGIFDQISEHFIQVLTLHPDLSLMVAGDVDGDVGVEAADRPFDSLKALPHGDPRMGARTSANCPRPRKM